MVPASGAAGWEQLREQFITEARLGSHLRHGNIVPVLGGTWWAASPAPVLTGTVADAASVSVRAVIPGRTDVAGVTAVQRAARSIYDASAAGAVKRATAVRRAARSFGQTLRSAGTHDEVTRIRRWGAGET